MLNPNVSGKATSPAIPQSYPSEPITMTMLMTPDMANFSGKVHGGALLKILDQVAYACASHYCGHYVVTLSVDQVYFREEVHVGELVTFYSSVNYVGKTSVEIGVKVVSEDIHAGTKRHAMSCYFTMVAVDQNGRPVEAPKLQLNNDKVKSRYIAARLRRQLRNEYRERLADIHEKWTVSSGEISSQEIEKWLSDENELPK